MLSAEAELIALRRENAELRAKLDNRKKLTARQVADIHISRRKGRTNAQIADQYGINSATVSRIVRGIYHG